MRQITTLSVVSVSPCSLFETEESIMVDIIHRVGIKAPPAKVYAAVATVEGVAGWWTKDATGIAKVGGTLTFRFHSPTGEQIGNFDMEVLELIPNEKVRWRVKAGPKEWI